MLFYEMRNYFYPHSEDIFGMEQRNSRGQTLDEFLSAYNADLYKHPSVTVDMAVFTLVENDLAVILIERRDHPCIGEWALPGGFLEIDEEVETAVSRELFEETGIEGLSFRPVAVFSKVGRDVRTRNISLAHLALAPEGTLKPKGADDASDARLFLIHTDSRDGELFVSLTSSDNAALALRYSAHIAYDAFSGYDVTAKKGDLAFDHSLILTHALITLANIDRDTVLSMLSPEKSERAAYAFDKLVRNIKR